MSKSFDTVSKSIRDGDVETAKWYISRRDDRFKQHQYYKGVKNEQHNYTFNINDGSDGRDKPVIDSKPS